MPEDSPPTDVHKVLELTRKLGREPNLSTALHIMQWELGDLAKSCTYMKWHPDDARLYEAEAKKALGDLLFQAEVVAQLLGTGYMESFSMGTITVEDRIIDMDRKIGRFKTYEGEKEDPPNGP